MDKAGKKDPPASALFLRHFGSWLASRIVLALLARPVGNTYIPDGLSVAKRVKRM